MKKWSLVLSIVVLVCLSASGQTVRRVNNTIAATVAAEKLYKTIQEAHDASVANDIIMVEPSPTTYDEVTLTKVLKIYGNGYFLDTNPELKADTRPSTISAIYFNYGSTGSAVYGLTIGYVYIHGASNITVARNNTGGIIVYNSNKSGTNSYNVSNLTFNQNYCGGISAYSDGIKTITGVLVTNNILSSNLDFLGATLNGIIIKNNTFHSSMVSLSVQNGNIENNIFTAGCQLYLTNTTAAHNYSSNAPFTTSNNNVPNFDFDGHFVAQGAGISSDEQYQFVANSSLRTKGLEGTGVGAFGGSTAYRISGIAPIPSVVSMVSSATGTTSDPIQVNITVKANN
jgi:hypothetical protein